MALDPADPSTLADSYVLVVASDGTCVLSPRAPEAVGGKPWDWCIEEDRERCREAFVRACMFREAVAGFETRMRYKDRVVRIAMKLFPLDAAGGGQVLCTYHRVFDAVLTPRERNVLALVAGGATPKEAADALGVSPSTVRDYVASLKRKLRIDTPEGLINAGRHYGLVGAGRHADAE
ncbi:MAG: helix-turn-helix transcriptional regulator [Planctomycetota bacterium]